MCGRYALALRPSQVRAMLQDENMPVYDAPDDDGQGAPRQSYNFAPGYHGIVYRAEVPDWGAGPARDALVATERGHGHDTTHKNHMTSSGNTIRDINTNKVAEEGDQHDDTPPHYILQSMKWGLIPFWTKRNPDYGAVMKTINCRDDSLSTTGGMWSTMKARKRCLVVAQGFYEWLKPHNSPKEKIPHYIKRKDGQLMLLAGLWDCVIYDQTHSSQGNEDAEPEVGEEKEKNYTYTIITTDSNKQLNFLHDRMPVIFDPGSEEVGIWLDPNRYEWSPELQGLLKPWRGELEVYPVSKEVGKVGNNSPSFIVPVASKENKRNIANFFAAGAKAKAMKEEAEEEKKDVEVKAEVRHEEGQDEKMNETKMESVEELQWSVDDGGMVSPSSIMKGIKRERKASPGLESAQGLIPKKIKMEASPSAPPSLSQQGKQQQPQRPSISATKNPQRPSPPKKKAKGAPPPGSQKITKFFGNSA